MRLRAPNGSLRLSALSEVHHQVPERRHVASSSVAAARMEASVVSDGSGASASSRRTSSKSNPIEGSALAPRRDRMHILVRVTALPPASAAAVALQHGGSEVGGIIMAMASSTNPTPNHSFKRTCLRQAA